MTYWLVSHGSRHGRLEDAWTSLSGDLLRVTYFPRRPRIEVGDRLLYYAVGWQRLHGAVEVTGAPRNDVDHPTDPTRWRWVVEVEPLLAMRLISRAPKLEEIGVSTKSVRRQSHIRIDRETFENAVDLLIRHGATGPLADASG